jgi:hypothetical protein
MSATNQGISYLTIDAQNILDSRHTGAGKTTSAIEYVSSEVERGRSVIVLMQSYERLENNYFRQFTPDLQNRALIFKGKTQAGMCKHSSRYSRIWRYSRPTNECGECDAKDSCLYQDQIRRLQELIHDRQGFVILTTDRLLHFILKNCNPFQPTIIVDDIHLSTIITPEFIIKHKGLEDIQQFFNYQRKDMSSLNSLLDELLKDNSTETEIREYILSHTRELTEESTSLKLSLSNIENSSMAIPDFKSLFSIIDASRNVESIHFFRIGEDIKIFIDYSSIFKGYRFFYLDATPSLKDIYCIDRLGDCKRITANAEPNDNYYILQIVDSANSKQTFLSSIRFIEHFEKITNLFKKDLNYLGQPLLLFTFEMVYQKWTGIKEFENVKFDFIKYFGSNTRGTNDFIEYPISMILGNPYLPPDYFRHPAFDQYWKKKGKFPDKSITDQEAKVNLLQMMGRTLRYNPSDPNQKKMVILFSGIDLTADCLKQNGGKVKRYLITARKEREKLLTDVKKACQASLEVKILDKMQTNIDDKLSEEVVYLDQISKELSQDISLFKDSTIKTKLENRYVTEKVLVHDRNKRVNKMRIVKRRQ